MTPYYSEDGITIYHGDCREVLPGLVADTMLTDPPYGTGYYDGDNSHFSHEMLSRFVQEFGAVFIFGWPENLVRICVQSQVIPDEWLAWWPSNATCKSSNGKGLRRDSEHVAIFGKLQMVRGRPYSSESMAMYKHLPHARGGFRPHTEGAYWGDIWTDPSPGVLCNSHLRLHPNEKPLALVKRLLKMAMYSKTVLDPFMGSGTTLRAAKDLGRKAIGIEIEERYCEIAAKRLSQGVLNFQQPVCT